MGNQEEIEYIKKHFNSFFNENGFALKESSSSQIVFENRCSMLLFSYETKYSPKFEELFYVSKESGKKYTIRTLFESFNKDLNFNDVLKSYMGEFGDLKMTDIQAYSIMLSKYFGDAIKTCDFSWEEKM